jgi:hypothetical protein
VAIVIILGFRRSKPLLAMCLMGAAILQLIDVQPLRRQIITSIANGPGASEFDTGQVARLAAVARQMEVIPSFQCVDEQPGHDLYRANMELMLAAARANVPTNSVYSGRESYGVTLRDLLGPPSSRAREMLKAQRRGAYCEREVERARNGGAPGDVFVLLSGQPKPSEMVPGVTCSSLSWARYCIHSGP